MPRDSRDQPFALETPLGTNRFQSRLARSTPATGSSKSAPAGDAMSTKNSTEKVSEIDSHVSKQYDIVRRLGKGAYGIVWKAIEKKNKEVVAVKKIFDAFQNQTDAQRTFREIMFLLSFANHENIIRLIGLHKANNDRDIYLVFEYMETDLHNVIKKGNILRDIHKIFIMYQLFKATKYIHSGNVIHRDLKPSNVLLNTQCHCKIADFGLARSVTQIGEGDGEAGSDPTLTDYVATRWYRAPEILVASKRYTKGIDMWSLGCILGEMLLGKPLFPGSSTINQVERIMATLPAPTEEDLISVSAGYGTNLLEKTPNIPRRSLRDLLPEVKGKALDLIGSLIVLNPTHRLTAVEALGHPYVAGFHSRSNEPERKSSVVPLLRDDVQLSVDEYRNKLYAMMDEKHRKHKNMSKSRIRRLSEHIRKEGGKSRPPVMGQGDSGSLNKTLAPSCENFRKDKKKPVFTEHSRLEATRTPLAGRKITQSQIDSGERLCKMRVNRVAEAQVHPETHGLRPSAKSVATQYSQNLMSGTLSNLFRHGATKSCLYLNQQQQQQKQQKQQSSMSQRSIQSDQVAAYAGGRSEQLMPPTRAKLRRSCRRPLPPDNSTWRNEDQPTVTPIPRDRPKYSSTLSCKYTAKMPNDTTAYLNGARITSSQNSGESSSCQSSLGLCAKSEAIRNYLSQTIPLRANRIDERATPCEAKNALNFNYRRTVRCSAGANEKSRSCTAPISVEPRQLKNGLVHCYQGRTDPRVSGDSGFLSDKTSSGSIRDFRYLNGCSQNHGIITASAYKELRNGSMG